MMMTAYEITKERYYEGTEDCLNKQTLALAYLQLHLDNPELHPNNHLDPEGGYSGWHTLLVHRIWTTWSSLPDAFKYPTIPYCFLYPVHGACDTFLDFHVDDEDNEFKDKLIYIQQFLKAMTVKELNATVKDLEDLVMFHDGAPEDVFEVLSQLCELLEWVRQLSA